MALIQLIKSIKNSTNTSLNLGWNHLEQFSSEELAQVIQALEKTQVTSLNLSDNHLKTQDNIILRFLPPRIQKLVIDERIIHLPDYFFENLTLSISGAKLANYLIYYVKNHIQKHKQQPLKLLGFENLILPFEINADIFSVLVVSLKQQKSNVASFICGLLLTNRIPHIVVQEQLTSKQTEEYLHDGITCLIKVLNAEDNILREISQFILWEMLTINQPSQVFSKEEKEARSLSIIHHLKEFQLTPPKNFIPSYYNEVEPKKPHRTCSI